MFVCLFVLGGVKFPEIGRSFPCVHKHKLTMQRHLWTECLTDSPTLISKSCVAFRDFFSFFPPNFAWFAEAVLSQYKSNWLENKSNRKGKENYEGISKHKAKKNEEVDRVYLLT